MAAGPDRASSGIGLALQAIKFTDSDGHEIKVSMPSVSGRALQVAEGFEVKAIVFGFLCPGIGLGFASSFGTTARPWHFGFYALGVGLGFAREHGVYITYAQHQSFYALGVGLGFARAASSERVLCPGFLCPRCRAGLCKPTRLLPKPLQRPQQVSMPSVSGWALQGCDRDMARLRRRKFLCPRCRAGLCKSQ